MLRALGSILEVLFLLGTKPDLGVLLFEKLYGELFERLFIRLDYLGDALWSGKSIDQLFSLGDIETHSLLSRTGVSFAGLDFVSENRIKVLVVGFRNILVVLEEASVVLDDVEVSTSVVLSVVDYLWVDSEVLQLFVLHIEIPARGLVLGVSSLVPNVEVPSCSVRFVVVNFGLQRDSLVGEYFFVHGIIKTNNRI